MSEPTQELTNDSKTKSKEEHKPTKKSHNYLTLFVVVIILLHVFRIIDLSQIFSSIESMYSQRKSPTLMDEFDRMGQPVIEQKRKDQKIR